ncbi:MAG: CopG family ribbon-helix-helix protein [Promethearchaeota archaeon]|jgi:metal-responsive CopG/Arc/MetJ family transcriptional regulator
MEEYKRFTISLPEKLYEQFEKFRNKLGISRSDAIRKAMHSLMISDENILISSGNVVGCITLIITTMIMIMVLHQCMLMFNKQMKY